MRFKKYAFSHILGWSFSKSYLYNQCKRKYYFHYYGVKNAETLNLQNKILGLKQLTPIELHKGTIIHEIMKNLLVELKTRGKSYDNKRFRSSIDNYVENNCKTTEFMELYYGMTKLSRYDLVEEFKEQTYIAVDKFIDSKFFIWLSEITNNEWIIEPPYFGETRLDGNKVYFKVDFVIVTNNYIYIIDWKSGSKDNSNKYKKQLLGYNIWVKDFLSIDNNINVDDKTIISYLCYLLPDTDVQKVIIDDSNLIEFKKEVEIELNDMRSMCTNIVSNKPKLMEEFDMNISNSCKYCRYKEICKI